jgi:hypothetical protein
MLTHQICLLVIYLIMRPTAQTIQQRPWTAGGMDPQGVREIYFMQSQNTCKHWKYIVRITDSNNVVYVTMINKFNNDICNNVFYQNYTRSSLSFFCTQWRWLEGTSRCATSSLHNSFCTRTKSRLFKINLIVLIIYD